MNKKILFFSMIMAISAISIGSITHTLQENQPETLIQKISVEMKDISLEKLGENADYAIVGKVVKIKPVVYMYPEAVAEKKARAITHPNSEIIIIDREILTDVKIKVKKDLFGNYKKKFITVRIPGGEIPGQKTIFDYSPGFKKGEKIIVFVTNGQTDSISENHYTVLGLEQGTFRLGDSVKTKFAMQSMSEKDIKHQIKALRD